MIRATSTERSFRVLSSKAVRTDEAIFLGYTGNR
jgi:hypothetical protein